MNHQIQNFIIDAVNQNHILIAGCTGSGKSVLLKNIIFYMLLKGYNFDIIDLKKVSLIEYRPLFKRSRNKYADTVSEAETVLRLASEEVERRYKKMLRQGIDKTTEPPRYIIIDEAADLFAAAPKLQPIIIHLLRLGRAANIRLIFATQSPDRKTISSQVQQNISTVFALRCRSALESRQVIGMSGAEKLTGYGYGFYYSEKMDAPELISIKMIPSSDIKQLVKYRLRKR